MGIPFSVFLKVTDNSENLVYYGQTKEINGSYVIEKVKAYIIFFKVANNSENLL